MAWRGLEENAGADFFSSTSLLLIASADLILVLLLLLGVVITLFTSSFIRISGLQIPCSCFEYKLKHNRGSSRRSKSLADYSNQSRRLESPHRTMEVSDSTGGDGNREDLLIQECVDEIQDNDLLKVLQSEREAQSALYHELEKERNAAATAANEAMAMITRLQEEKALAQMEARQFQRMVEEKTIYDRKSMEVLKELLARQEEEKQQLEMEIRICKMKLLSAQEDKRHQAVSVSSVEAMPALESSTRKTEASVPSTTGISKRRTGRSVARGTEKSGDADLIRETRSGTAGIDEAVLEKNNGQEPAAGFRDKEIEEKGLSVLEYVWRFEEQLQQQGGSRAARTGRPKSAGETRTKVKAEGRTMRSESSRKADTLISEIMEKDLLRRRLFEEEVTIESDANSFSFTDREDNRGSGKLEREESPGTDGECRLMGEHPAEDLEEGDLFMQDIYEVHNAAQHVVMQDKGDCRGWDCGRRYEFDSDRLGKPDLLILHEEEGQDSISGEDAYHPEDLCDKETRDSTTIRRDSAPVEDEVMHLTLRLKALEADRDLMKQIIESLRRENGEMKLLQEIAQQLRELRGMEQKDLQQQLNPLPFASSCQTQLSKLASVYLGDVGTGDCLGETHVGLGHLLHSSPKSTTCITRVRRADIPSTLSAIQSKALEPQQT